MTLSIPSFNSVTAYMSNLIIWAFISTNENGPMHLSLHAKYLTILTEHYTNGRKYFPFLKLPLHNCSYIKSQHWQNLPEGSPDSSSSLPSHQRSPFQWHHWPLWEQLEHIICLASLLLLDVQILVAEACFNGLCISSSCRGAWPIDETNKPMTIVNTYQELSVHQTLC